MSTFSFENLDVYQRALSFSKQVLGLTTDNRGNRSWCDQFNRAAMSVVLNIAEGSGRYHMKDKLNFYYIARGSAFECVPLIDIGTSIHIIDDSTRITLRSDLLAIAQMLTKLIQNTRPAST